MRRRKKDDTGEIESIREAALYLLGYRARSCHELRERLHAKGFAADDVDELILRFCEVGLLDDERFARDVIRYHTRTHPLGRFGLMRELRLKGIADELSHRVLDEELPAEAEVELALAAIKRILNRKLDVKSKYKKAMGYLNRRGFGTHTLNAVQAEILKNREFEEFPAQPVEERED
jgi:regulatory protein